MSRRIFKFWKIGLPSLVLLVGGSFGLSYFTQEKYDQIDRKKKLGEDTEDNTLQIQKRTFNLEDEYQVYSFH
jgi:hypothetical protein